MIGERLGVAVSPAIFFECEHIDALARHLASRGAQAKRQDMPPRAAPAVQSSSLAAPSRSAAGRMSIAIIGIAARLPGADTPETFIDRLLAGDDLTGRVSLPPLWRGLCGAPEAGRVRQARRLPDRRRPLRRRLLPHLAGRSRAHGPAAAPDARDRAGGRWRMRDTGRDDLPRDTGVFVGVSGRDYASLLEAHHVPHDGFAATGNSLAMVANRISYQLDVHGPSEAIDTACSSSLVALGARGGSARGRRRAAWRWSAASISRSPSKASRARISRACSVPRAAARPSRPTPTATAAAKASWRCC